MSYYGFTVTDRGRALIAKLVAGESLSLSRIMVGSGLCSDEKDPRALSDLIEPVAAATSTTPKYEGASVKMTVEYRSDLNGGLERGFWLNEFGIFAFDPDEGEVMIYYGSLGDYPQWVGAYSSEGIDVRRFPVCIVIGDDRGVKFDFNCEAWMTEEDVHTYYLTVLAPLIDLQTDEKIALHNVSPDAHQDIRAMIGLLESRLSLLELMFNTNVTENKFMITFETLDDVNAQGVWNENGRRIEF